MDDDSDADLYGDLLPFDRKNDEDFKKVDATNASLRQENYQLKQEIERLLLENRALAQDKKKLETNFSSLIKTAQTEMKRKDQTIAELRREKDTVVFRRGRNTRYDNRQDRNHSEPRHEVERAESFEQSYEPVIVPKPSSPSVIGAPVIEAVAPMAIPSIPAEVVTVLKVQDAEITPDVPTLVPKSDLSSQTVFSRRHSSAINKSITETTEPIESTAIALGRVEDKLKTLVPSEASTPEINPEAKKKKRITPVMISEPVPRVVDQNKNKIISTNLSQDQSTSKIAKESRTQVTSVCEVTTPKAAKIETNNEVPAIDPIQIPKSKIITHVKASFDTSNSKTTDFKRRVSTNVQEKKLKPESSSKSPLTRNPSLMSENSSDGLRRPSNYDLMKRNIKHKYHSLESPKKSDRSRRSRSRSVWAREKRDRSKSSHRTRSERKPESRRKDGWSREDESFKRRSPSRRQSKGNHSHATDVASKRDSSPARRKGDSSRRKVPTYGELLNFSPMLSSTAKKDSERKSSLDRLVLDSQVTSTSKSKARLDDVLEKSTGNLSSTDKLNRKEVETAKETSRTKAIEAATETASVTPTETAKKASSSACNAPGKKTDVTSPSKQTDAKRKSIEAVADSLTFKLTSTQTTETITKTVGAFTLKASLMEKNVEPVEEPQIQPTNVESTTTTKITDVISVLTNNIMPIPPKDFLTARILADYKTPTASSENSREVSQGKTMSPPEVPRPKSGHAPTSFSGIKLGGDPKHFSYPFTPMKVDIANEYISFPSMITPLKATPVKADFIEEDSLDLMMRLQLARNADQLGKGNAVQVERTVTRAESEVEWKLHTLESSDSAGIDDNERANDVEGKVDETVDKLPEKSVNVSDEIIKETPSKAGEKETRDMEDGEITDDSCPAPPTEPEKPMVTFFKKGKETKSNRTRLVDVKRVVSPNKMMDLRQRLLARTECVAPPRKDIRDYEIRLKSPFKTSPRISSSSGANRSARQEALSERLTYNDYPPKSGRSRSPESHGRLSRSRSPTSMFLEKSPERFEDRKSGSGCTSPKSASPRHSDAPTRANASHGTSPKRHAASTSRSQSPRDSHRARSHRKSPVSLSRSPSPKPTSAKRPQRLQSVRQSRSRSPMPSVRKGLAKPVDRSDRIHSSSTKGHSRSNSKSPSRETQNGQANVNERLRRLAGERNGGDFSSTVNERLRRLAGERNAGDFSFQRRQSRCVVDGGRRDWSAGHSQRRSRSKSRSRSSSPNKPVAQRSEGRHSRSQDSPKKTARGRDRSESRSPERMTRTMAQGNEGRHSRTQDSSREVGRGRDRSGSRSPGRRGGRVGNNNSAQPFRRRRTVFKTSSDVREEKVSEQLKLIERILDSNSGISEKNISPVSKSRAGAATPDKAENEADGCSYATLATNNLPDILSTLDSSQSSAKSPSTETVPGKPKSLDKFVNNLIQTANPDMQKCLESVRASFTPPPVAAANKTTQQKAPLTSNGFGGRKRRTARFLPQETPAAERSPAELPAPDAARHSEVTPAKTCDVGAEAANETASVTTGSQAFSPANSVVSNPEATRNGLPFSRRRRTVRMLPQSENTNPNPTPTKESATHSPSSDSVASAKARTDFPILESVLGRPASKPAVDKKVEGTPSVQRSSLSNSERNLDSESSERTEKRKREDGDEGPGKKRSNGRIVSKQVVKTSDDLERKAKSLFGSDTEEEDFTVKHSEYAKLGGESSDDDPYVSEGEQSEESDDEWKPARSHSRKVPADPLPQAQSIWPAKPEEPKRRTTVFLEDLPKSSEKLIAELMDRANRSLSAKKKKRHSVKPKATSKAPKSAEFVPTDDSD